MSDFVSETEQQKQEYWESVQYAKNRLTDYYGTATGYFPMAYADLARIETMSPEEILYEARRNRLI